MFSDYISLRPMVWGLIKPHPFSMLGVLPKDNQIGINWIHPMDYD